MIKIKNFFRKNDSTKKRYHYPLVHNVMGMSLFLRKSYRTMMRFVNNVGEYFSIVHDSYDMNLNVEPHKAHAIHNPYLSATDLADFKSRYNIPRFIKEYVGLSNRMKSQVYAKYKDILSTMPDKPMTAITRALYQTQLENSDLVTLIHLTNLKMIIDGSDKMYTGYANNFKGTTRFNELFIIDPRLKYIVLNLIKYMEHKDALAIVSDLHKTVPVDGKPSFIDPYDVNHIMRNANNSVYKTNTGNYRPSDSYVDDRVVNGLLGAPILLNKIRLKSLDIPASDKKSVLGPLLTNSIFIATQTQFIDFFNESGQFMYSLYDIYDMMDTYKKPGTTDEDIAKLLTLFIDVYPEVLTNSAVRRHTLSTAMAFALPAMSLPIRKAVMGHDLMYKAMCVDTDRVKELNGVYESGFIPLCMPDFKNIARGTGFTYVFMDGTETGDITLYHKKYMLISKIKLNNTGVVPTKVRTVDGTAYTI